MNAQRVTGCWPYGAFLCSDLPAMVRTSAGNGWLLSARVVAELCAWVWCTTSGKVKLVRDSTCTRPRAAVRTVLCKDGHQMHAAVDAGGDENVRQMCALPIRCSGGCAKRCAHELRKLVRRQARVLRTAVVRLSHECTRLSFEVVLQVSKADKSFAELRSCVLRLPRQKGCR